MDSTAAAEDNSSLLAAEATGVNSPLANLSQVYHISEHGSRWPQAEVNLTAARTDLQEGMSVASLAGNSSKVRLLDV